MVEKDFGVPSCEIEQMIGSVHSEAKLSWHIVFRVKNKFFHNNKSLFNNYIQGRLFPYMKQMAGLKILQPFVDVLVYHNNQNFKLMWSTKFGGNRYMKPETSAPGVESIRPSDAAIFYKFLIAAGCEEINANTQYMTWNNFDKTETPSKQKRRKGQGIGSCKKIKRSHQQDTFNMPDKLLMSPKLRDVGWRLKSWLRMRCPQPVSFNNCGIRKYISENGCTYVVVPFASDKCLMHGRKHSGGSQKQYLSISLSSQECKFKCQVQRPGGWKSECEMLCPAHIIKSLCDLYKVKILS